MSNWKFGLIAFVGAFLAVGAFLPHRAPEKDRCEPLLDRFVQLHHEEDARALDAHIAWKVCRANIITDQKYHLTEK